MEVLTSRHEICMKILALKLPFVSFAASKIDCSCLFNTENLGCCLAKAESFIWKNKCSKFGLDIFSDEIFAARVLFEGREQQLRQFCTKMPPSFGRKQRLIWNCFFQPARAIFKSIFRLFWVNLEILWNLAGKFCIVILVM